MAIDQKYKDMLDKKPKDKFQQMLEETVENLIECAICGAAGEEFPNSPYKSVGLGFNPESGKHILRGEISENKGIYVEFSDDCKTAYIVGAKTFEVQLSDDTAEILKKFIENSKNNIYELIDKLLPFNPIDRAIEEFTSEVRYGSNRELTEEFLGIYNKFWDLAVSELGGDLPGDMKLNLNIINIIEFLKDHKADISNVHLLKNRD